MNDIGPFWWIRLKPKPVTFTGTEILAALQRERDRIIEMCALGVISVSEASDRTLELISLAKSLGLGDEYVGGTQPQLDAGKSREKGRIS